MNKEEFKLHCRLALGLPQVLDIYLDEVEAAQWDDAREDYADIALEEYLRRNDMV